MDKRETETLYASAVPSLVDGEFLWFFADFFFPRNFLLIFQRKIKVQSRAR